MSNVLAFLMQQTDTGVPAGAAAMGTGVMIVWLVVVVLMIAAMWKVFSKAGQPGWAAIIPIYNYYVIDEIAGRPGWWLLLWFVFFPIPYIVTALDIAKRFGKGAGFGVGLMLLPIIFWPMLAWGDAKYTAAPAMA
ncbi:MAG TPA: DUF5684 domain-containing protein [Thermoanaerobaculia bacterium]|nr:DUF5684 domain-containing protein [Thermoanaerobaculia bacterium]